MKPMMREGKTRQVIVLKANAEGEAEFSKLKGESVGERSRVL